MPFDLTTIDSQKANEILVKRIINIGRSYIDNAGKIRDGSAVLLSKLITRPDVVKSGELDTFLQGITEQYTQVQDDPKLIVAVGGVLQTLVEVFKTGHRDDLLTRVDIVFDPILKSTQNNKFMQKSSNLKKARVNLA